MNDESSLARNATAAAISLGLGEATHRDVHEPAGRPLGVLREQLRSSGVFTGPGDSAFTRMPSRANCTPSSRDIASTPPLHAV